MPNLPQLTDDEFRALEHLLYNMADKRWPYGLDTPKDPERELQLLRSVLRKMR